MHREYHGFNGVHLYLQSNPISLIYTLLVELFEFQNISREQEMQGQQQDKSPLSTV